MNLIVNTAKDWGIGNGNELLFHFSGDMKFFRSKTIENVVVMGRKTLDSFPGGKPLPKRINIVLTRNKDFSREGVIVCHSQDELNEELKKYEDDKIFIIGGDSVYKLMLPYCDTAFVTKVDASKDADTFMVNLDELPEWKIVDESESIEEKGIEYKYVTYKKSEEA